MAPCAARRGHTVHALIIEEDYFLAELIQSSLSAIGYTSFDLVSDEEEAVQAAIERCPDLITSDVELRGQSGIDAVEAVCAEKPIPVVYVTVSGATVRARVPGAVVVQKPFGMNTLAAAVEKARSASI